MNWELILKVVLGIVKTFCYFGLGALAVRTRIFSGAEAAKFGKFAIDILIPFFTFYSIVKNFTPGDAAAFWQLPLIGFGIMLFGLFCGYGLQYGMRERTPRRGATFVHLATVNNYAFLPLILLDSLYGLKAVAYLFLMSVGSTVGFWTLGIFALAGADWKRALRNILSPNVASVVLAMICVLGGLPVPEVLMELCRDMGGVGVPLALILTGSAIFAAGARLMAFRYDAVYTLLVRLVILPVLTVLLLNLLPLDPMTRKVSVIVALMPASCASALIVKQYGGSADFASQSIVFSTVCSAVSIPLLLLLFHL